MCGEEKLMCSYFWNLSLHSAEPWKHFLTLLSVYLYFLRVDIATGGGGFSFWNILPNLRDWFISFFFSFPQIHWRPPAHPKEAAPKPSPAGGLPQTRGQKPRALQLHAKSPRSTSSARKGSQKKRESPNILGDVKSLSGALFTGKWLAAAKHSCWLLR